MIGRFWRAPSISHIPSTVGRMIWKKNAFVWLLVVCSKKHHTKWLRDQRTPYLMGQRKKNYIRFVRDQRNIISGFPRSKGTSYFLTCIRVHMNKIQWNLFPLSDSSGLMNISIEWSATIRNIQKLSSELECKRFEEDVFMVCAF